MTTNSQTEAGDPAELAAAIHNDVLQSLGVAVLGVDLCRRFHQQGRYEMALEEIGSIGEALALALASSENLLPSLNAILPTSRPSLARPSLAVIDTVPGSGPSRVAENGRPAAGPQEIVDTLTVCADQARRCRHYYDSGLGDDTMQELEMMLQRLEFVSTTFRDVMGQLRQLAGRPLMPQAMPAPPAAPRWSRSA